MVPKAYALSSLLFLSTLPVYGAPLEKLGEQTVPRIDSKIYTQPNRYGEPVSIVGRGLKLKVLKYSSTRAWAYVETPSLRRGWIPVQSTTLGLRYSASSLSASAKKSADAKNGTRAPASQGDAARAPASDLDGLGYSGSQYEEAAQDLVDTASNEAESAPPSDDTATEVPDVMTSDSSTPGSGASSGNASATSDVPESSADTTASAQQAEPDNSANIPDVADAPIDPAFDENAAKSSEDSQVAPTPDTQDLAKQLAALEGNAAPTVEKNGQKKSTLNSREDRRQMKIKAKSPQKTALDNSAIQLNLGAEYANQINIGSASGFGLGVSGSMPVADSIRVGLGVFWDYFLEKAQNGVEIVTRRANVFRVGPLVTFQKEAFGLDALVGWTQTATKISVTDLNGTPVTSEYNGSYSQGALGLRFSPHFDFPVGNGQSAIRAYVSYGIDFYPANGGNTGMPQTLALGASYLLGF